MPVTMPHPHPHPHPLDEHAEQAPREPTRAWRVAAARFPAVPSAVPQARRFARRHVGDPAAVDQALLLVSELATNALEHAGTAFEVTIVVGAGAVRIEVADGSYQPPAVERRALDDEGGRGMRIVEGLAAGWGVGPRADGEGKVVWCELPLTPPAVAEDEPA